MKIAAKMSELKEQEKCWPQTLAILISTLAGITNGLLYSWSSPFLLKITQDKDNYDITEEEASYFTTIQPLSIMVACPIFSKLSDVIGRKKTLLLIVIPQITSWLCAGFAKSVNVFYLGRICSGIAEGCLFAALPSYIGEIANPTVRGTWGNMVSTSLYFGEFLINIIGSFLDVKTTSIVCLPITLLFLVLFVMMPESPYFYIMKGEEEKAKSSLRFLKRMQNVDAEYASLKRDVDRQLSESASWSDLVKIKSNRRALTAGLFLRFSQQMSGFTVFYTYTQFIFLKAHGNVDHEICSMVFLGIALILNVTVLLFVVNRLGRRICFMTSLSSTGFILYILAMFCYTNDNTDIDLSEFNWVPIACMILFILFASFGVAVVPTLMLSELFSTSIKSKAMTIVMIAFGLGSFLTNYIFYYLDSLLGFYSPFLFFAFCNTVATVIAYYIVPETKGKTLEQIQQQLKRKSILTSK